MGLSRSMRNASLSSSFSFASSSTRRERRQLFKEEQKPEQHDDTFFPPEKNERRTAYIETYGCQMNAADSEVIAAVLTSHGYEIIESKEKMISMTSPPEVILVNTCAIRDKAEERVKTRLRQFRSNTTKKSSFSTHQKKKKAVIGVLGCMGERIKGDLLKKDSKGVRLADIVAGPDSYRDLPRLIENAISNNNSSNSIGKKENKKEKREDDDNEGEE